jgi:benzoate/toluate 1,2-dioxygenase beta subunit
MTNLMQVAEFIQKEASLLDDRKWDEWLDLYHPQAEYWVPMWDDDGTPTTDPQSELSLIYYDSRKGLEDRIFRINTGKSSATTPLFRTCHIRSLPLVTHEAGLFVAAFNWVTHAYRTNTHLSYFGKKKLWLEPDGDSFKIRKAYTLIDNDLIDQVVDVYHL